MKLKVSAVDDTRTIDAIIFFAKGSLARTITELAPNSHVNLLAHLERNTFSRGTPVRLRLLNLRPS